MKRTYRCPVVGTGAAGDERRPTLAKHADIRWEVRDSFLPGAQRVVVEVEATLVQHTVIALDTAIEILL